MKFNKKKLKKKSKDYNFDENKFKTNLETILPKIKLGLEEEKCLLNDGLMNLELNELNQIKEELLVFLVIAIQAYPENGVKFEDDKEIAELCNWLTQLTSFATLQKLGYGKFLYGYHKLDLQKPVTILELLDRKNPNYIPESGKPI